MNIIQKTRLTQIVTILLFVATLACQTADDLIPTSGNEITGLSFILPDGKKIDVDLAISDDNNIDVEIEDKISTDMSKLRMLVNVPNNATVVADVPLGTYMDFTKPVSFDVISPDGEKRTYTVNATLLATEIEVNELWRKTGSLINFSEHNNRSVGISDEYLVVHDRSADGAFKYYYLETGEEAGSLSNKDIDLGSVGSLHMISDDAGNIVTCSFVPGEGSELRVYWWDNVNSDPELLLSWLSDAPGNIGRKLYVKGDMNSLAYLYATVSNNDMILRWEVKDGKVTSNIPEKIEFNHPNEGGWGTNGKIVPISVDENSNFFINSKSKVRITYMNGDDNTPIYNSEDHIQGVFHQWLGGGHAFDYVDMRGAHYIFMIEQNGVNWMSSIYNVRQVIKDPSKIKDITSLIHTRVYKAWEDFPLDPAFGGKNGNVTGEVRARVAEDGKSAIVAFISTNGGVKVWKVTLA